MERTTIEQAKDILGSHFLGVNELRPLFLKLNLDISMICEPEIQYSLECLKSKAKEYLLVLGIPCVKDRPISIFTLYSNLGMNPDVSEPCFYNQDWYLNEEFIHTTLEFRWYLIKKEVIGRTRAVPPQELLNQQIYFPSAILCAYTFFSYYFYRNECLWLHDFIWCSDLDHNGDRIYVGKYHDIDGINKNGFSIHRHLALRSCYASVNSL